MDADVARMMADLGLARRDLVSAPEADAKGRPMRGDPRRSQAIVDENEARRERARTGAPQENEQAAKIRAWNTDSTFERDELTGRLENRFSGQGHRATIANAIKEGRIQDRGWEAAEAREAREARFGEERGLYLQERQANGNSDYVAKAPSMPTQSFRDSNFGRGTPRAFSGGQSGGRPAERGRLVSSGTPTPHRAPSPRAGGTVRITSGSKRVVQPPTSGHRATPTTSAATKPPGTLPNSISRSPITPATTHATANRATATNRSPSILPSGTAGNALTSGPHDIATGLKTQTDRERFTTEAKYWAANPGPERDEHYSKYPDRRQYLRPVFVQFIKDALMQARDPYGRGASEYGGLHESRAWIFEAALIAKDFVENKSEAEPNAYYMAHPDQIEIFKGAKANFKPKLKAVAISAPPSAAPTTAAAAPSAVTHTQRSESTVGASNGVNPSRDAAVKPSAPVPAPRKLPGTFPEDDDHTPQKVTNGAKPDTSTAASKPKKSIIGLLIAVFKTAKGSIVQEKRYELHIPGSIHVRIVSEDGSISPARLTTATQAFADSLNERSQGTFGKTADSNGMSGTTVAGAGKENVAPAKVKGGNLGELTVGEDGVYDFD